MRILFFIESLQSGGKERRLVELIKGLNKQHKDLECEIVLMNKQIHYQEVYDLNLKIHYLERSKLKKDPLIFYGFYKICKKVRPDIVNVWGNMVAFYAILAKVCLRIPLINNQITDVPTAFKNAILGHKVTFAFSDLILANSHAGVEAYNPPRSKTNVIYNGFDFIRLNNLENKDQIRKKLGIETRYIIGMVASFSDLKDYTTYLKAAVKILNQNRDVTFICIGAGDSEKYKKMIPEEFFNNVKFLGVIKDVESVMNVCDIGVLTSFGEGISNALIEFMALGKPVLSTNLGGTPELIIDNQNGFLLEPFNSDQLSERISILLSDQILYNKIQEINIKEIRSKFSMDRMVNEFYNTYSMVLRKCAA